MRVDRYGKSRNLLSLGKTFCENNIESKIWRSNMNSRKIESINITKTKLEMAEPSVAHA